MKTLSNYTTKRFAVTVILALFLGGSIIVSAKLAVDMSFQPRNKTVITQGFAPEVGNLTLSATLASENEVILNVTFAGTGVYNWPGYVWTIWISNSIIPNYRNLTEFLMLVDGTLMVNVSCPVPGSFLGFQARLRAAADGECVFYVWFSATNGPGFFHGISSGGIKITVSNGRIIQLEKEQTTPPPESEEEGEMQKVPSPPY